MTPENTRTLYGRRRGKKLRTGQEALLDALLPRLLVAVPPEPQKLDLSALFGEREVWLEVDDGNQVHLKQHDVVIQNGTRHAWRNHGDKVCRIAVFLVGAHHANVTRPA